MQIHIEATPKGKAHTDKIVWGFVVQSKQK